MSFQPEHQSRSQRLLPGMLLTLYGLGGVILLAVLNGVFLSLLLSLLFGPDQALAARPWTVPLSFVLAVTELILYEWRRARPVDLVARIHSAIREVLARMPAAPVEHEAALPGDSTGLPPVQKGVREGKQQRQEQLRRSLEKLQQLLTAAPDPMRQQHVAVVLQETLRQLEPLLEPRDVRSDRLRRLQVLLVRYQRRQIAGH
jgi:hypothetical protein